MKLNRNDYTVEAAAGGGFYAYFMNAEFNLQMQQNSD